MRHGKSDPWIAMGLLFVTLFVLFAVLLRNPHTPAVYVKQKAQLRSVDAAIELFNNEMNAYPPSDANDPIGKPYCGAMKLAEALMGQDLFGCHSSSIFRRDGLSAAGAVLYPPITNQLPPSERAATLTARKGPYLAAESASAWRLVDVYGKGSTGPFPEDVYVLCDTYVHKRPSGKKTGMPILYYRANRLGTVHQAGDPNNVYDHADNQTLITLGVPDRPGEAHPLLDLERFYRNTQDDKRLDSPQPFRSDSYILISAGRDGLYGTPDDICNFEWRYREQ